MREQLSPVATKAGLTLIFFIVVWLAGSMIFLALILGGGDETYSANITYFHAVYFTGEGAVNRIHS